MAGDVAATAAPAQQPATTLHIAAAADLQPVLPVLADAYRKATGVQLLVSYGSSAILAQQLTNGAPQDIFLSADFVHPEALVAAHLAVEPSPVLYARGVLVLWARKDSPAQPLGLPSLLKPSVTRIAVANDQHAPYGVAATAALHHLNLAERVAPKLVVAENIAQTAQFAESGNAQAGLISLTLANSPALRAVGTYVTLPTDLYPPILQSAVVLRSSTRAAAAEAFLRWLTSPEIQSRLHNLGLEPAR